jgi:hypothetical protein
LGDSLVIVVGLLDRRSFRAVGTPVARVVRITLALDQFAIDNLGDNSIASGTETAHGTVLHGLGCPQVDSGCRGLGEIESKVSRNRRRSAGARQFEKISSRQSHNACLSFWFGLIAVPRSLCLKAGSVFRKSVFSTRSNNSICNQTR